MAARKRPKRSKARTTSTRHGPHGSDRTNVWQAAAVRIPGWVEDEDEDSAEPYRPWGAVAVSLTHGLVGTAPMARGDGPDPGQVQEALRQLAKTCGAWPDVLEVRDPDLVGELAVMPELEPVEVVHRPNLAGIDSAMKLMAREFTEDLGDLLPPATSVPGVTVDSLRAFAQAAAEMWEAQPWRELENDDIIAVRSPVPDPAFRHICCMGASGHEYGLLFLERAELFLELSPAEGSELLRETAMWSLSSWHPTEVDFAEHDLWLDAGLPTVEDGLLPVAVCFGPKRRVRRASPKVLAFLEGVLRAIARTTPEELDAGPWQKTVPTSTGQVTLELALETLERDDSDDDMPSMPRFMMERQLLAIERLTRDCEFESEDELNAFVNEQLEHGESGDAEPRTVEEEAQELAFQAMEAHGRRRRVLARQALALWPDCADALGLMAGYEPDLESAAAKLEEAVRAGERALGEEVFAEHAGRFWGVVSTRPYMRARFSLAEALWDLGRTDEAVAHYRALLELNPEDNQGVRQRLLHALIVLGEHAGARELLERYEEPSAIWWYTSALLDFLETGDSDQARQRLDGALECNPFVPEHLFLWLEGELPPEPPYYRPGDETEAIVCVSQIGDLWEEHDDALNWLGSRALEDVSDE